jgi:hypothetical protein
MRYVYSKPMCSACDSLKKKYKEGGVEFVERSGERLDLDPRLYDDIDRKAFITLQMQNLTFPVEVVD